MPMMGMIYSSSVDSLTYIKKIETCVESVFTTVCVRSAIAGCFPFILERTVRSSCIASSHLIKEAK
jgi:hypothetical protein